MYGRRSFTLAREFACAMFACIRGFTGASGASSRSLIVGMLRTRMLSMLSGPFYTCGSGGCGFAPLKSREWATRKPPRTCGCREWWCHSAPPLWWPVRTAPRDSEVERAVRVIFAMGSPSSVVICCTTASPLCASSPCSLVGSDIREPRLPLHLQTSPLSGG